jgi:3-oxoadipate enol-lactonase
MPRIDASGVELFYESLGEGTPLILHGHDHTPWMFFQAPIFSQTYRFITYDRRGTGRSGAPDGDWTIADFARDLRNLMDALGIERAIGGGSSLGGYSGGISGRVMRSSTSSRCQHCLSPVPTSPIGRSS